MCFGIQQFVLYEQWYSMFFPNVYEIHVNQSFIIKIYHKWKVNHRIEAAVPYEGSSCWLEIMHQRISMWQ